MTASSTSDLLGSFSTAGLTRFGLGLVIQNVTVVPGWYPDPFASGQLRWWDGVWTSHTAIRRSRTPSTTALSLGIVAFVLICFPIGGVAVSVIATALAVRAVRRDLDNYFAVSSAELQPRNAVLEPGRTCL